MSERMLRLCPSHPLMFSVSLVCGLNNVICTECVLKVLTTVKETKSSDRELLVSSSHH